MSEPTSTEIRVLVVLLHRVLRHAVILLERTYGLGKKEKK